MRLKILFDKPVALRQLVKALSLRDWIYETDTNSFRAWYRMELVCGQVITGDLMRMSVILFSSDYIWIKDFFIEDLERSFTFSILD